MLNKKRTATAYQRKVNERGSWSGSWTEHRISKCWKDQLGKGRNKRTTQYRPVCAY